jgi:hypothetical protein
MAGGEGCPLAAALGNKYATTDLTDLTIGQAKTTSTRTVPLPLSRHRQVMVPMVSTGLPVRPCVTSGCSGAGAAASAIADAARCPSVETTAARLPAERPASTVLE